MLRRAVILATLATLSLSAQAAHIQLPLDADGWTVFTPSADSRIVYVSTEGSDESGTVYTASNHPAWNTPFNPGEVNAFSSYAEAYSHTRAGYPDWILMRRGDVFYENIGNQIHGGRSATEPFLIAAYGSTGTSPQFNTGAQAGIDRLADYSWLAISGISFYAHTRDPDNAAFVGIEGGSGIRVGPAASDAIQGVLIEGVRVRFYTGSLIYCANPDNSSFDGIRVRRSVFLDSYVSSSGHTQAIWAASVSNLVLEENVFDHNGWYGQAGSGTVGEASTLSHNLYFSAVTPLTYRANIISRGASGGIKLTNSRGTIIGALVDVVVDNNLLLDNEIALSFGFNYQPGGSSTTPFPFRMGNLNIVNNVITHSGKSRPTNRTLAWGMMLAGLDNGSVSRNLIIHQEEAVLNNTVGLKIYGDMRNTLLASNILYNLEGSTGVQIGDNAQVSSGNTFRQNIFELYENTGKLARIDYDDATYARSEYSFDEQRYSTSLGDGSRFYLGASGVTDATWTATTGDNFSLGVTTFVDPTRDVDTYMRVLGREATLDAFIQAARAQDRYAWDDAIAAKPVNAYIRAGFYTADVLVCDEDPLFCSTEQQCLSAGWQWCQSACELHCEQAQTDAGTADARLNDTSSASDNAAVDSVVTDSAIADTVIADAAGAHDAVLDAIVADRASLDAAIIDSATVDANTIDAAATDSLTADASNLDAGSRDSTNVDSVVGDGVAVGASSGCSCSTPASTSTALLALPAMLLALRRRVQGLRAQRRR